VKASCRAASLLAAGETTGNFCGCLWFTRRAWSPDHAGPAPYHTLQIHNALSI